MRLFRRKKSEEEAAPVTASREAIHAFEESEASFTETKGRWPEVIDLVTALRSAREQNNFEVRIRATLEGGNQ